MIEAIHRSIRAGNKVYGPGDEAEATSAAEGWDLERLAASGVITLATPEKAPEPKASPPRKSRSAAKKT